MVLLAMLGEPSFCQDSIVDGPQIEFGELIYDYGNVPYGGDPISIFTFTNTGTEPLIISKAKCSCSCLTETWSTEPILPGESNVVRIRYDMKRPGMIRKSIWVYSNAINSPITILRIKGNVLPKPEE